MDRAEKNNKSGYYTVNITNAGRRIPYVVFASSDYHAARLVRHETGYLAQAQDIEGPYGRV